MSNTRCKFYLLSVINTVSLAHLELFTLCPPSLFLGYPYRLCIIFFTVEREKVGGKHTSLPDTTIYFLLNELVSP